MSAHLYLAAAAHGKTAYLLDLVREASQGLRATPRVVVPSALQARSWRRRLALAGGAIGVQVQTFDPLYSQCLSAAGEATTELSEPVQYRLLRSILDSAGLEHYAPLVARPGFVGVLQRLVGQLKSARIEPGDLQRAVDELGGEPRLVELARIYALYQERLQALDWADRTGLGWLAVESLEKRAPAAARDWPLLVVDGFDSFTTVQLALLAVLARRVGKMVITLTGEPGGGTRPFVHDRFARAREELEAALGVQASPLPVAGTRHGAALAHLGAGLFQQAVTQREAGAEVALVEAPDRSAEVRAALRWLKARLVVDGMRPEEVALLARSIAAYRPFVLQVAAEFGLPVRLVGGVPLRTNPAVAALLDLLRLVLLVERPGETRGAEPALPRRGVVEAWRSPYFDWTVLCQGRADPSAAPHPEDAPAAPCASGGPGAGTGQDLAASTADALDIAARWGRVIGGLSQWEEALSNLADQTAGLGGDPGPDGVQPDGHRPGEWDGGGEGPDDEDHGWPRGLPRGAGARALLDRFRRFVGRLTPPQGENNYRSFVSWLEDLIGPDPALQSPRFPTPEDPDSLRVVVRARSASVPSAERDVAALRALKEIMRGLVWAEDALGSGETITFSRFVEELAGAVEAASYSLPADPEVGEIVVADVVQARGVPYRAVAVLGLAEGEFPAAIREDAFLRDADRDALRLGYDFSLEPSTASWEAGFFYETVTRARERLLLTRPRLADNGAPWQASPYWEEVRRLLAIEPERQKGESLPPPHEAASWPELLESLASHRGAGAVREWVREVGLPRHQALELAVQLLHLRSGGPVDSPYDGGLASLAARFQGHFAPERPWSASRLETYRSCPFHFCVEYVLGLEPREDPVEGLDRRQLGTIYHQILERVYWAPSVKDPADLDQLLSALPGVGAEILDTAPGELGFRETAWWAQTRVEIMENVRRSLEALGELPEEFVSLRAEAAFGRHGRPVLIVRQADDHFRLRGYIDRVDRAPDGRVRVIDYKSGGPSAYSPAAVRDGKKLQLPLYALAARDALQLGESVEGFYWHVERAEPSGFKMSTFDGGPQGAMDVAVEKAWEAVRGARDGHFVPQRPEDGCPPWCPATVFCWHYQQARWG